jgi:hypothetical protein
MIMSRYSFGLHVADLSRFRANVTQRYTTLHQRYRSILTVTDRYRILRVTSVTLIKDVLIRYFNFYK